MNFTDFFQSVIKVPADFTKLPFPVSTLHIQKGAVVTDYGQVEENVYFIQSGILEMNIKSYMTEKIIDFFFENEMVCGFTSFLTQQPTDVQIKALTEVHMEFIRRADLIEAYKDSLEANQFGRVLTEQGYIRKSNREKDLLTKTAEEKYAEMFATHSKYISQIPVNKIAKYLGIHPESLSRIRKKLNS
ncbi:Crp/Fnr family transcriptional regulator [Reichenbachiella sp.]|uniref:Crp/Fnr family transcriptional regulator n=1 Tax=Reichenbachiella sp. TaxID=2184521 RepID=UPI003B5B98F6